jgi:hypothetical protein
MFFWISVAMAMSIVLPAFTGLLRFANLPSAFGLFVVIIWLGFTNELVSLAFIFCRGSNAISYNYYILIECVLLILLFFKWDLIHRKADLWMLVASAACVWFWDNAFLQEMDNGYGLFNVYAAVLVLFFATGCITSQVNYNNGHILADGKFLVGTGLLLHYGTKAITDTFFIMDMHMSNTLAQEILLISSVANLLSNLFYLFAIICLNRNQKFTLEYW